MGASGGLRAATGSADAVANRGSRSSIAFHKRK